MRADRLASGTTRSPRLALLLLTLAATHAPGAAWPAPRPQDPPAQTAPGGWLQIRPRGEEFAFQSPVAPGVYVSQREGDGLLRQMGGTEVKRQLTYHAYHDGVVYLVHVYKASSPQSVMNELTGRPPLRGAVARDVSAGGVKAREYEAASGALYRKTRFVTAGKFLYVLEAAARDAANPNIDRFLSSLTTGRANAAGGDEVPAAAGGAEMSAAAEGAGDATRAGEVVTQREATRKAAIVYRPEPLYTDEARRKNTTGTIRLRMILSATGEVTNVTVAYGLPNGLTETAIAAAHATRFLPAEKDGRRVSQYVTIEYNYNIY
ncbi:MAG TPA: energy transducer TonB [Pyrinomonadaceae bacterium]|jgi:TonB family protein|nr:energy transducer TonB [Pyrinomonadaceae bacterium]